MQQQECTAIVVSKEVLNVNSFKHNITHTFYKKQYKTHTFIVFSSYILMYEF